MMEAQKGQRSICKIEDFEVLNVIGSGSFGTCYRVCSKIDNRIYVWKAIDYGKMNESKKKLLVSEVNLLSDLRHPNIVRYYDRILHKETTTLYIIMECCQGGDLASLILSCKKNKTSVEESFIWQVLYQTGRALQACHSHLGNVTVLHRDIKPANVFLDAEGNVKLGDFGLARILKNDETYSETVVGTPYYMSPEVLKGGKYNRKSDIWALGCLIYELCSLSPPFLASNIKQLASSIKNGRFNRIPLHFSDDLQKIIVFMLSVDHEFRPTIEMILHHPTVVLHISQRTVSKYLQNRKSTCSEDNTDEELNEFIKSMSVYDRDPVTVSEKTFKEKWMVRLEALRQKEAGLRAKEESLLTKERTLAKKERQVSLMERIAKEKITRAEVYLRQCKENKSVTSLAPRHPKLQSIEEIDTSLSADPGDASFVATSAKIAPHLIARPSTFVRSASERRPKHVQFNISNQISEKLVACGTRNAEEKLSQLQPSVLEHNKSENVTLNVNRSTYVEHRATWLENKRLSYTTAEKENCAVAPVSANATAVPVKKKQSKGLSSMFSKKSLMSLR